VWSRARPVILSLRRPSVCNFLLICKSHMTCLLSCARGHKVLAGAHVLTHSRRNISVTTGFQLSVCLAEGRDPNTMKPCIWSREQLHADLRGSLQRGWKVAL
jgi:hypothetical protein